MNISWITGIWGIASKLAGSWSLWAIAASLAAGAGGTLYYRADAASARADLATAKADHDRALADAIQKMWDRDRYTRDKQQEARDATLAQIEIDRAEAVAVAASAVAAEQRMRNAIAAARRAADVQGTTAAEQRATIAALGDTLGSCLARHRELGARATEQVAEAVRSGRECERRYDALTPPEH